MIKCNKYCNHIAFSNLVTTPIICLLLFSLKIIFKRQKQRANKASSSMSFFPHLHCPNDSSCWDWARLKPELHLGLQRGWWSLTCLNYLPLLFQAHQHRSGEQALLEYCDTLMLTLLLHDASLCHFFILKATPFLWQKE